MIYTPNPAFWEQMLLLPVEQRCARAPDELLTFIGHYNEVTNNPAKPQAVQAPEDFIVDVQTAIEEMPEVVKERLAGRLLGVFLMTGVGSSAVTDVVARANGELLGAVVAIDVDVFSRVRANEWITWRENTAFVPAPGLELKVTIADVSDDTRKSALQYVLLHEFGHVLTANTMLMPDWWVAPNPGIQSDQYAFLPLSWQINSEGAIVPLAMEDFPWRKSLVYYESPTLLGADLPVIYRDLLKTGFPTLYAALSVFEDFAECFANYVHVVLLKKPFDLNLYRDGKMDVQLGGFWTSAEGRNKASLLELLFSIPPMPLRRLQAEPEAPRLPVPPFPQNYETAFLGLAPFLRISVVGGDLRPIAQMLLAKAGEQENNPYLWMNLATAFFTIGQRDMGLTIQAQALEDQRSYDISATQQPAKHRLLILMAAGDLAENTPLDCLLENTAVDLSIYFVSLDAPLPISLPEHDALFVAISDTEVSRPILKKLEPLLAQWHKPVINLPQYIVNVERATASDLLHGVDGLVMPLTREVKRSDITHAIASHFSFPIILRPVGSHAGHDLDRIVDDASLGAYLAKVEGNDFYISRFVDYSGSDGLFRKYRIALINGQPFASHMAISSHWMIHYLNAGMYEDATKRAEEEAFMANFDAFAQRHQNALSAISQRAKLEYVCVDCAETRSGELLVFEIDHAMVVHAMDSEALFPYKQVYMQQVKQAFQSYLSHLTLSKNAIF